jgi:hypothetical protein
MAVPFAPQNDASAFSIYLWIAYLTEKICESRDEMRCIAKCINTIHAQKFYLIR